MFSALQYSILQNESCSFLFTSFQQKNNRTNHQRCSMKKGVLKYFTKFTGKHLCQSLFFNKVIKNETLAHVFSCEFCDIFKNTFFTDASYKTRNYLQISLTIHKPAKLPTNHPNHSKIIHKPATSQPNHPQSSHNHTIVSRKTVFYVT